MPTRNSAAWIRTTLCLGAALAAPLQGQVLRDFGVGADSVATYREFPATAVRGDTFRIRIVLSNFSGQLRDVDGSFCDQEWSGELRLGNVKRECPGSRALEPGDSAWLEFSGEVDGTEGSYEWRLGAFSRETRVVERPSEGVGTFPALVRVPLIVTIAASSQPPLIRRYEIEAIVRRAARFRAWPMRARLSLELKQFILIPANRRAAEQMTAVGPYLEIDLKDEGGWYELLVCWKGTPMADRPCERRRRSEGEGRLDLALDLYEEVQELMLRRGREAG